MSWPEFVLRSVGHRKKQEREETLFRAVAYQAHCSQYVFSKAKPPKIDAFWKIGTDKKQSVGEEQKQAFLEAMKKYKEEKEQKNGR